MPYSARIAAQTSMPTNTLLSENAAITPSNAGTHMMGLIRDSLMLSAVPL